MKLESTLLVFGTALATALACLGTAPALAQAVVSYSKPNAKIADVRDDLRHAIESRGFVIDYQAQIGAMLERTGKDVGSAQPIYTDAVALQFCSAKLSRRMMEADPANVVLCPYVLVVYATAAKPDQVQVSYRRPVRMGKAASPASRAALREVEALMDSIAREAVGRK
jgi:uncharacterized protein (DUF302 family)